ncbi:MAG: methylmalonyl-CoA carboxyltransferase [Nitrososphaeria archaeon]|nr:methylmalonyl-CoA carboxyltransferase [Nitrososphaeria archaeon]NIN52172.1 methylmalonyl-CoA carboxyltransferase [Nitrososphaeria archaeon]NIQ32625.1 methylmalonyl-CoA carboxyltransferase [Nitrososphaeria archaeon]
MEIEDMLKKLREKKRIARSAGGQERIKKQKDRGKLTARERVELLLDTESFLEFGELITHRCTDFGMNKKKFYGDGVITGFGTVNGKQVAVYAQDFTVLGGSVSEQHAKKIYQLMDMALEARVPIIGLIDSGGARIQEGPSHYGGIFLRNVLASGLVPQITVMLGPCAGGASYSPAITDFIVMVKGISYMFITGPRVIKTVTGQDTRAEEIGDTSVHSRLSGVAHLVADNEEECMQMIRRLLSFLPSNNDEQPPIVSTGDDENRTSEDLEQIIPTNPKKPYDMKEVILRVIDNADLLEIQEHYAKNIIIGLARLDGRTVGMVANQPIELAGCLDINGSDKAARFIRFCDAFNIPIINLVDSPGYLPGIEQEHGGIIRHGAKMLFAYGEATVPKITVVVRKAYGGILSGMCVTKYLSDLTLTLPTAEIAVMGPQAAIEVLYRDEIAKAENAEHERALRITEYREKFVNPYVAAERGFTDDIIEPRELRHVLIRALKMFGERRKVVTLKKHGNIPL